MQVPQRQRQHYRQRQTDAGAHPGQTPDVLASAEAGRGEVLFEPVPVVEPVVDALINHLPTAPSAHTMVSRLTTKLSRAASAASAGAPGQAVQVTSSCLAISSRTVGTSLNGTSIRECSGSSKVASSSATISSSVWVS